MALLCIITKEGFLEEEVFHRLSLLETNRLNEILSCNKLIISEMPDISDNYN